MTDPLKEAWEFQANRAAWLEGEVEKLNAVASERWHALKACEKLNRQMEKSLVALLYIAKTDKGPVHSVLKRDIREAEKVLETVQAARRAKRTRA